MLIKGLPIIVKLREGEKAVEYVFKSLCSVNGRDSPQQAQLLNLSCTLHSPGSDAWRPPQRLALSRLV